MNCEARIRHHHGKTPRKSLTMKAQSLTSRLTHSLLTALTLFGATTLATGCDEPVDLDGDVFVVLGDPMRYEPVEAVAVEMDAATEVQLQQMGIEVVGDAWMASCNLCVLTQEGAYCTDMACPGEDPDYQLAASSATCLDGEFELGDVWENDCNTCTCGDGGAVCTLLACDPHA
jgi:hypothetical protein